MTYELAVRLSTEQALLLFGHCFNECTAAFVCICELLYSTPCTSTVLFRTGVCESMEVAPHLVLDSLQCESSCEKLLNGCLLQGVVRDH